MSNPKKSTQSGSPVDHPGVVRPRWMTGSPACDWPEDSAHENGNYFNKCVECGSDFSGHKRRHVCRKCHYEVKARKLPRLVRQIEAMRINLDSLVKRTYTDFGCEHPAFIEMVKAKDALGCAAIFLSNSEADPSREETL